MRRSLSLWVLSCATVAAQDGAAIYRAKCAECHDKAEPRVPSFSALRAMGPAKIIQSIETGGMKTQAAGLSSAEKHALMFHLAVPAAVKQAPPRNPHSARHPPRHSIRPRARVGRAGAPTSRTHAFRTAPPLESPPRMFRN